MSWEWTAEDQAEYEKTFGTDMEIQKNKDKVAKDGLTAMVKLELGPEYNGKRLWQLVLDPVEGQWTHVRKPEALREHLNNAPYHISICFNTDIDRHWKKQALDYLIKNYSEPFKYTFWIERWTSGMTAVPKKSQVIRDIEELHQNGQYWNREIHISM